MAPESMTDRQRVGIHSRESEIITAIRNSPYLGDRLAIPPARYGSTDAALPVTTEQLTEKLHCDGLTDI